MASRQNFSPLNSNPRNPAGNIDSRRELLGTSHQGSSNPGYSAAQSHHLQNPNDVGQINIQINKTTDDSLASTRRMVGMMEESQEAGAKTMENLYRQGEQLDKVEDNMDTMNADMREAEKNMNQMEKCCGMCVCPWRKRKNYEKSTNYQKSFGARRSQADDRMAINMEQPVVENVQFQGQNQQFIQRITNDAREDEMDENLNAVGNMLGGLKNMAVDMGGEIGRQNNQLDRMNGKAIVMDDRVTTGNKRANEILKNA